MKALSLRLWVRYLCRDTEGQDLVEYGLLMVLIALFAIAAIRSLGTAVANAFSNAAATLSTQPGQP